MSYVRFRELRKRVSTPLQRSPSASATAIAASTSSGAPSTQDATPSQPQPAHPSSTVKVEVITGGEEFPRKEGHSKRLAWQERFQAELGPIRKMNLHKGECIGILTSGGDAQGMNAAVRAVVRVALQQGVRALAICEGYQGLIDDAVVEMGWGDVSGIIQSGGTAIGTARCDEFRERSGMKKAVHTLVRHGITKLVIVGGDGSLRGGNKLRKRWKGLVAELAAEGKIRKEDATEQLLIVGMVGSIDNDMCGTDMTIGADSALNRIVEAVDAISSTAASHKRSFVVEVMGRHCGWLALMAAVATGADYVLLPEAPMENWEKHMCEKLQLGRDSGNRMSVVIVAEGALDIKGQPITSSMVKKVLDAQGHDTRITILGHVQRGGSPSAYDRIMSTRVGAVAVETLFSEEGAKQSKLIGTCGSSIVRQPLMQCVKQTNDVARNVGALKFKEALVQRGVHFEDTWRVFRTFARSAPHQRPSGVDPSKAKRIAIMHAGAAAPGMNTAVRAVVRLALDKGFRVFGVRRGFDGLRDGDMTEFDWMSVNGWSGLGGSLLGTTRSVPRGSADLQAIEKVLIKNEISALLLVGGWEALEGTLLFHRKQHKYPGLGLPKVLVPATISNNMPATEFSLGSDTALNSIVVAIDRIKQSAISVGRVFIVEVMGARCGYLALMSALATGAELVYLPEEGIAAADLLHDCKMLVKRFRARTDAYAGGVGLLILNEAINSTYKANFIANMFSEESEGAFDTRTTVLGHLQQGGEPSPLDRIRAIRMANFAVNTLEKYFNETSAPPTTTPAAPSSTSTAPATTTASDPPATQGASSVAAKSDAPSTSSSSAAVPQQKVEAKEAATTAAPAAGKGNGSVIIGEIGGEMYSTPLEQIPAMVDETQRRPKDQWWLQLKPMFYLLAAQFYS